MSAKLYVCGLLVGLQAIGSLFGFGSVNLWNLFSVKTAQASTGINQAINYQGKLMDSAGNLVADGDYSIKFTIYNQSAGGTQLWSASTTNGLPAGTPAALDVTVNNGLFSILLGDINNSQVAFPEGLFNNDSLYLGITIGADAEMTPRKRLAAVPYAFNSQTLQGQYASNTVANTGGDLFALRQASADSAASTRTALYIETKGTSNLNDFLIRASDSTSDVFTVSRQGNVTSTGNLTVNGSTKLNSTLNVSATSTLADLALTGRVNSNLLPYITDTYTLGNSTYRWLGITAQNISVVNVSSTNIDALGYVSTTNLYSNTALLGNVTSTNLYNSGVVSTTQLYVNGVAVTGIEAQDFQDVTDLGVATDHWIQFAGATSTNNIVPNLTNSLTLGTENYQWLGIFAQNADFTNVSTTNLDASGYIVTNNLTATNADLTNVSSTNIDASGYITADTINSNTANLGNVTTTNLYNSGTVSTTQLYVNGVAVTGIETQDFQDVTDLGVTTNHWIQFAGATSTNHFLPGTNNLFNLGSTAYRWANLFAVNGNFTGTVTTTNLFASGYVSTTSLYVNGTQITGATPTLQNVTDAGYITSNAIGFAGASSTGHFLPTANITYDLGSSSFRWRNLYAANGIFTNVSSTNIDALGYVSTTELYVNGVQITGGGSQDLQDVTDLGYVTTNPIRVAGATSTDQLFVLGSQDAPQLIVQANATQDLENPLIQFRNSAGTVIGGINTNHESNIFAGYESGAFITSGTYNTALGYRTMYNSWSDITGAYNTAIGAEAMWGYSGNNMTGNDNTAVGYRGLSSLSSGYGNTAVGYSSLANNTTGYQNNALGWGALKDNTTGWKNVAIGVEALTSNIDGESNTSVGNESMFNNNGDDNVAVGKWAMRLSTTADQAVAIGVSALSGNNATGTTGIGYRALYSNTSGENLSGVGHLVMDNNSTGSDNTAMGASSLYYNQTGSRNTALGTRALHGFTGNSHSDNTGIGYFSLFGVTTGSANVAMGVDSLYKLTTGASNTAIGYKAGSNITSGSNNILIGNNVNALSATGNYHLNIGDSIYGDLTNDNIGIGVPSPYAFKLTIDGHTGPSSTNAYDLGSSSLRWRNLYASNGIFTNVSTTNIDALGYVSTTNLYVNGSLITGATPNLQQVTNAGYVTTNPIRVAGASSTGHILPVTTLTYDLGSSSNRWKDVWASSTYIGDSTWNLRQSVAGSFTIANVGGSERMTIDTSGNVGIGDTTPTAMFTVGNGDLFQVNSSGRVLANVGASGAGNLAYSFVGDTDTGFYRSATNEMRLQTAGADRVTIDPSGNVGIGETSPSSRLHVNVGSLNGTSSTAVTFQDDSNDGITGGILVDSFLPRLTFKDRSTGAQFMDLRMDTAKLVIGTGSNTDIYTRTSDLITITNIGNVGIGDTNPVALLTVGASDAFQVNSSGRVLANVGASGAGNLAYSFVGDTDTGLYRSAADEMRFQTAGADRLTIRSTGFVRAHNSVGLNVDALANHWNPNGHLATEVGYLGTNGSYGFDMVGNGYRNSSAGWTSLNMNSQTGGTIISLRPVGEIIFGTDATVAGTQPTQRMVIANNGYVGIGDSTPAALLTVGNGDRFQVDTNGNLIRIKNVAYSWPDANASGLLRNNGSGTLSWDTATYLTSYTETDPTWSGSANTTAAISRTGTVSLSALYPNGSAVDNVLVMEGTDSINRWFRFRTGGSAPIGNAGNIYSLYNTSHFFISNTSNGLAFNYSTENSGTPAFSGATQRMVLSTAGNLGVGVNPNAIARLHVDGGEIVTSNSANSLRSIHGNYGLIHRNDGVDYYQLITASGDQYGTWNTLRPYKMTLSTGNLYLGNNALTVLHAGKVGVNETSPASQLHVKGAANETHFIVQAHTTQSNTSPLITLRNSAGTTIGALHSDHAQNIFLGVNAGQSNNQGGGGLQNTFVGSAAGPSNTTGAFNSAFGFRALYLNNTGSSNNAIGVSALNSNQGGTSNTGFGNNALYTNVSGNYNVAMGNNALFYTTASNNVGIGHQAAESNAGGSNNIAIGYQGMYRNTSGSGNIAIGYRTLYPNQTGANNTAVGYQAIFASTGAPNSASNNSAFGYQAMFSNTTGHSNVAIGYEALRSNTTNSGLTAVGYRALYTDNGDSQKNTAVGFESAYSIRDAANVTAVGYQALRSSAVGIGDNTAIGALTLYSNTSGNQNTAVGSEALYTNTTGYYNTANGYRALYSNNIGFSNTAVGNATLYNQTTGRENVAIGNSAGYNITSARQNVVIGVSAGLSLVSYGGVFPTFWGYGNTIIGYGADTSGNTRNSMALGNGAITNANDKVRIGNTSVNVIEGQVNWSWPSDSRVKTNIADNPIGLSFINRIRPVKFESIYDLGYTRDGFIAQEVRDTALSMGYRFSGVEDRAYLESNGTELLTMSYSPFDPIFVNAIQEIYASSSPLFTGINIDPNFTTLGESFLSIDTDGNLAYKGATIKSQGTASTSTTAFNSHTFSFMGSAWDMGANQEVRPSFNLINNTMSASSSEFTLTYSTGTSFNQKLLTITNSGDVKVTGDLHVGRRLYLGSKTSGESSTSTYIFVDDTLAPGSTYISTNADGWQSEDAYDYAERFESSQDLKPGDIVTVDPDGINMVKRATSPSDPLIGIVSTKPGFVTGRHYDGWHPIALAGRVPTRVSTMNGPIRAGDYITATQIPGVGAKAKEGESIIGIALESYNSPQEGLISVFVKNIGANQVNNTYTTIEYGPEQPAETPGVMEFAMIKAGQKEVNVTFDSLGAFPSVIITPYGSVTGAYYVTNVKDTGFTIVLTEEQTFDLLIYYEVKLPKGNKVILSDGTVAEMDTLTGQVAYAPTPTEPTPEPEPEVTPEPEMEPEVAPEPEASSDPEPEVTSEPETPSEP